MRDDNVRGSCAATSVRHKRDRKLVRCVIGIRQARLLDVRREYVDKFCKSFLFVGRGSNVAQYGLYALYEEVERVVVDVRQTGAQRRHQRERRHGHGRTGQMRD